MPAWCFPVEALTQPRSSIAGTERSTEPATSIFSTILAEDVVSMRRGAHEGEEIVRRMELALPCGLRPDCNAVTVAVESPEEKRGQKQKTFQEQAPATESRIK